MYCVIEESGLKREMESGRCRSDTKWALGESGDQLLINHNHAIQGLVLLWTVSLWKND